MDKEIEKQQKNIAVMVDQEEGRKYPTGTKACFVPTEFEAYERGWSMAHGWSLGKRTLR